MIMSNLHIELLKVYTRLMTLGDKLNEDTDGDEDTDGKKSTEETNVLLEALPIPKTFCRLFIFFH
jgi:hypothetical protein